MITNQSDILNILNLSNPIYKTADIQYFIYKHFVVYTYDKSTYMIDIDEFLTFLASSSSVLSFANLIRKSSLIYIKDNDIVLFKPFIYPRNSHDTYIQIDDVTIRSFKLQYIAI